MGDQEDGHVAVPGLLDQLPGVPSGLGVESGRHLVEDCDLRAPDQCQCDGHALLETTRQGPIEGTQLVPKLEGFNDLVMRYQAKLSAIYASGLDKAHMREAKQQAFAEMKQSYLALRESWHGWSGYDRWFAQDLNNAHLASVATYTEWVGAFHNMMEQEKGDLPAFYGEVRALARLDKAQRDARLENSTRPL